MRIEATFTREIRRDGWNYCEEGLIRTRPRAEYKLCAEFHGRQSPEWDWGYPAPFAYTWDHSATEEVRHDFRITYRATKAVADLPERIEISGTEWVRKGHVWRAYDINGERHTQEVWYRESWQSGTLYKDLWIEWDRGKAQWEVRAKEGDGVRFRKLYQKAKRVQGPPGFFWYKEFTIMADRYVPALLWAYVQSPAARWMLSDAGDRSIMTATAQDFGYNSWPPQEWVKIVNSGRTTWIRKEKISENDGEVRILGSVIAERR